MFLSTVQKVWRTVVIGNPMFCVTVKLRSLQSEFKKLNSKEYSAISDRVQQTKAQLEVLQLRLGSDPSNPTIQLEEKETYKCFLTLSRAEESLARQKSRVQWLKLGDLCTSFFFKSVTNNRNRSKITSLVLDDSSISNDMNVVKDSFVNYYSNLLGKPHLEPFNMSEQTCQSFSL